MRHILVTTDLSPESSTAFPIAAEMAKRFEAKVTLLAVVEDPTVAALAYAIDFPIIPDPEVQKQLVARVRKDLAALAAKHFPGLEVAPRLIEGGGPVSGEILRVARDEKADLIIMATHGRTGLSHLILGSVTEKVIRQSPCPIVTVPVAARPSA